MAYRLKVRLSRAERGELDPEAAEAARAQAERLAASAAANLAEARDPTVVGRPIAGYAEIEEFVQRHRGDARPPNPFEIPESEYGEEVADPNAACCPRCGEARRLIFDLCNVGTCGRCEWTGVLHAPGKVSAPAPNSPMALRYGQPPPQPRMHVIPTLGGWS
jgi:hypothetical protein